MIGGDRGFTYFAQGVDGGPIKIGRTLGNPSVRVAELQTGSPVPLRLVGILSGVRHEAAFHARFAGERLHGEWFMPSQVLLDAIADAMEQQRDVPVVAEFRNARFWEAVGALRAALAALNDEERVRAWPNVKAKLWDTAESLDALVEFDAALVYLGRLV